LEKVDPIEVPLDTQIKQLGIFEIKINVREVENYMKEVEERNCQIMEEINH
jgi:hypothetical protein